MYMHTVAALASYADTLWACHADVHVCGGGRLHDEP